MLSSAGPESVRSNSRAAVLATLRQTGSAAHTDIAQWAGLSSATVTAITGDLERDGSIERVSESGGLQAAGRRRGRPKVHFRHRGEHLAVALVRIAADHVEYSRIDYAGTLKDRFLEPRPDGADPDDFATLLRAGLARLIDRGSLAASGVGLVSVTTKGFVDVAERTLLWSPVLEGEHIDFRGVFPDFADRIELTNEMRFAALALAAQRIGTSRERLALVSLDNAVGLGIARHDGFGSITAEALPFSHMVHTPDGPLCRCGARGCIEAHAGFYGILRTAFDVDPATLPARNIPPAQMDAIAERARAGDRKAQYAFRVAGEAVGTGLSRLISLRGTMPIALTGPGIRHHDLFGEALAARVGDNLEVRHRTAPSIELVEEEGHLIFSGNVRASLWQLDARIAARSNRVAAGEDA